MIRAVGNIFLLCLAILGVVLAVWIYPSFKPVVEQVLALILTIVPSLAGTYWETLFGIAPMVILLFIPVVAVLWVMGKWNRGEEK